MSLRKPSVRKVGGRRWGAARRSRRPMRRMNRSRALNVRQTGIPDRMLVKLPYSDAYQNTFSGGTTLYQQWNLTSIFDPDRTGLGHQPLYYDQYSALYRKFRVFRVDYEIYLTNLTADTAFQGVIIAEPFVSSSTDESVFESPHARRFILGNREGISAKTIKGHFSLPHIFGLTPTQWKTDSYTVGYMGGIGTGGNPGKLGCLRVLLKPLNSGIASCAVDYSVRLKYHTELFERKIPILSATEPDSSTVQDQVIIRPE